MPNSRRCEQLRAMDNDDFARIVDDDIRNKGNREDYDCLREDEIVLKRWYATLVAMKKSVENQFNAKDAETRAIRAELETRGDHEGARQALIEHLRWKAGVTRFKTGLEQKLADASWRRAMILSDTGLEHLRQERNLLAQRTVWLEAALTQLLQKVDEHRDGLDDEDVYSKADVALWDLARQIRDGLPSDIKADVKL